MKDTDSLLEASYVLTLRTNWIKVKRDETHLHSQYRMFKSKEEYHFHIVSEYEVLAQKE